MIITELKKCLLKGGIKKSDVVCIFSDIANMGIPKMPRKAINNKGVNLLLDAYLETFKNVVKQEGTIIMPTFTYSACNKEEYDTEKTKSQVGAWTEYFRLKKRVKRSGHPIFSFAAWGNKAAEYTQIDDYDCFGNNSIFSKLYAANAKYILFGVNMQHGASFVHYSEQKAKVYYRKYKEFDGIIRINSGITSKKIMYYARRHDIKYEDNWNNLEKDAIKAGVIKELIFNQGKILVMNSKNIDDFIVNKIMMNNDYLIKKENK